LAGEICFSVLSYLQSLLFSFPFFLYHFLSPSFSFLAFSTALQYPLRRRTKKVDLIVAPHKAQKRLRDGTNRASGHNIGVPCIWNLGKLESGKGVGKGINHYQAIPPEHTTTYTTFLWEALLCFFRYRFPCSLLAFTPPYNLLSSPRSGANWVYTSLLPPLPWSRDQVGFTIPKLTRFLDFLLSLFYQFWGDSSLLYFFEHLYLTTLLYICPLCYFCSSGSIHPT
jgi:hypothetical protein